MKESPNVIRLNRKKRRETRLEETAKGKEVFKEYKLRELLGEGSFGKVFLVENHVGVPFALKVLHRKVNMEKRGLETVMKIRSNRLVSLLDHGKTVDGVDCVLMEYIPVNLDDVLKRGALDRETSRKYFEEILKALKVLEDHRIIHRDIKPANLFVLEDIIKIGDFGTAKYIPKNSFIMSDVAGTFNFMAPERFRKAYGFSVDRWSAAVIFYRMLSGEFVFDGEDRTDIFASIMMDEPNLDIVPEEYRDFFTRCFQKKVERRHSGVGEMLSELSRIQVSSEARKQTKIRLRSDPMTVQAPRFRDIFKVDGRRRPLRYIKNDFRDNGNETVTDLATGAVWQKAGSPSYMTYQRANAYIDELNLDRFAGSENWRLPTVDELLSLLEPQKRLNGLFIDPIFDNTQTWCWSSDVRTSDSAWIVYFDKGNVYWNNMKFIGFVRAVHT